jgi:MFS family permease
VSSTATVFWAVLRNRDLRRVELAFVAFNAAEYAVWLAMLVYAYDQGGATAASLVAVFQLVPAMVFAPIASVMADRHPPVRVLTAGYVAQTAAMGATGTVILASGPAPLAYVCAAAAATAVTITRPAQATLTPALAHTAQELTATNVVSSWVENTSVLVATAGAGVIMAYSGPGQVFALMAGCTAVAAVLVAGVHGPGPAAGADEEEGPVEQVAAGIRVLAHQPNPRFLVGLLGMQFVIIGAFDVLYVVLALDVLHVGQGWVGYLNAGFAAGGVAGSSLAVVLITRRRLAPPIALAVLGMGVATVLLAWAPSAVGALLLLMVVGGGRAVLDVGARTLLQRVSPAEVLGRVFGMLEAITMAGLATGALVIPPLIALGGSRTALIGCGALIVAVLILSLHALVRVDRSAKVPIVEISLLRTTPLFATLPPVQLEGVAHALEPVEAPAGTVVITQGDDGDRYYAIASGSVEVVRDGVAVATLARGEGFGETALLRDAPRNATVTAVEDTRLFSLEKAPFITAITSHAPAQSAADSVIDVRDAARQSP